MADVLGWLAAVLPHADIAADFSEVGDDDISACLAYAVDSERRLVVATR